LRLYNIFSTWMSNSYIYLNAHEILPERDDNCILNDWQTHFKVANITWFTVTEYLWYKWERICSTCRKAFLVLSSFMIYHRFVTRLTRHVPLVEWELLSLSEHLISSPIFSGVGITRSLVLYVCFVARCLSFCPFSLAIVLSVLRFTDSDYPFSWLTCFSPPI
jgi:hypothetical protein